MTHIYKIANGSLSTTIGDTRLFYTGNYSERARSVSGIFVDNPAVLSADYATLVWRYDVDTDRYMLVHVQGSQTVDAGQGRNYAYRAAYEVTRDELNALEINGRLPFVQLMDCMPRISPWEMTKRVSDEHDVLKILCDGQAEAVYLSNRIIEAFANGKPLYVTIDAGGGRMHENGVFSSPELDTLLKALEQLPVSIARYATFAFCADEHHAAVMDNILVNVVVEGSKMAAGVETITWAEAVQPYELDGRLMDTVLTVATGLAGDSSALTPVMEASVKFNKDIRCFTKVVGKRAADVATDEWDTWLIRHSLGDIKLKTWDDFIAMSQHMPAKYVSELAALHHANALVWEHDDRMYDYVETFDFSENELAGKLNLDLLVKLNRRIIAQHGGEIEQENILSLYEPHIITNGIGTYKNLNKGGLDISEKLLSQCVAMKKLRGRRDYAFNVVYVGVIDYLCQRYANIDSVDTWGIIVRDMWKMKVQDDGNKKKTLAYPLVLKTLKVVFQSRINAMTDNELLRFTSEVANQYGRTKDKGIIALVRLFYDALGNG